MVDCVLGEIRTFAGYYAPEGWALCDGSLLAINDYQALYSLLGTTWGGDGVKTFGLPDLRGRLPVGQGQGPSLTKRTIGDRGGSSTVQLTVINLPAHNHTFSVSTAAATANDPVAGAVLAVSQDPSGTPLLAYAPPAANPAPVLETFESSAITVAAGGNQPHDNIMPYQALTFIIAVIGIYPNRPN
jgi:microcystin-dependent protein